MLFRPVLLHHTIHNTARVSSSSASSTIRLALKTPFALRYRPFLLTASVVLGFSLPFLTPRPPIHLDTTNSSSSPTYAHSRDARTPLTTDSRSLNPAAVKQISLGSILGLGAGVLVSAFSRTLTLLFGVGIVLVQYAASRGYNIIPVERIQKYIKGINLRSAINDNAAFKMSFGLIFALAAFGEF